MKILSLRRRIVKMAPSLGRQSKRFYPYPHVCKKRETNPHFSLKWVRFAHFVFKMGSFVHFCGAWGRARAACGL